MAARKNRRHSTLQRSASTLTSSSVSSKTSTFSRIWGSFRRSHSSNSVSDGFKVVNDRGQVNVVEIIRSISELDNSVVSFNHGNVETIPPGKTCFNIFLSKFIFGSLNDGSGLRICFKKTRASHLFIFYFVPQNCRHNFRSCLSQTLFTFLQF